VSTIAYDSWKLVADYSFGFLLDVLVATCNMLTIVELGHI